MKTKEETIKLISSRIEDEYRKHSNLDWQQIAASKIYTQWSEFYEEKISELNEKTEAVKSGANLLNQQLTEQLSKNLNLESQLSEANERVKELEEVIKKCDVIIHNSASMCNDLILKNAIRSSLSNLNLPKLLNNSSNNSNSSDNSD